MNIYYLGPYSSYSHLLATKVFPQNTDLIACNSFYDIVSTIQKNTQAIGILAIENSISSSVHQTVDLLYNSSVCIVGEASMNIRMHLIGIQAATEDTIKTIYSHTQALAQCSSYIAKHHMQAHETLSTSAAVQYVRELQDPTVAAIGNLDLIDNTHLKVVKENIANVPHNMTRWVFISQPGMKALGSKINKVTYIFKVKHQPGSLVHVLQKIAEVNGNLTKIESRPLPGTNWEYGFWVDIEIEEGSQKEFDDMMNIHTLECRCVGSYERGKLYS